MPKLWETCSSQGNNRGGLLGWCLGPSRWGRHYDQRPTDSKNLEGCKILLVLMPPASQWENAKLSVFQTLTVYKTAVYPLSRVC